MHSFLFFYIKLENIYLSENSIGQTAYFYKMFELEETVLQDEAQKPWKRIENSLLVKNIWSKNVSNV